MVLRFSLAAAALASLLAASSPAALAGPAVTVRVEGETSTLLPSTPVTLPDAPSAANVAACGAGASASNAFEALEGATGGNWDRQAFFGTVLGESHTFANSDYWGTWVERAGALRFGAGVCGEALQAGDEYLVIVDVAPPPAFASTVFPLVLGAPAIVRPGEPFTVGVDQWAPDAAGNPGSGERSAAASAQVTGAEATVTTGAGGAATVVLDARGPATLQARRGPTRSRPVPVCVTDGADGFCATARPGPAGPSAAPDTTPALGRIAGIRERQRFARGRGPRTLGGTVEADASGLRDVLLRLTRRSGKRCQTYDAARERLVTIRRCGAENGRWFSVGDRAAWSYLLPFALPAGRWVLDTRTVDGAGNVTRGADRSSDLQAPRNRVVFTVG